MHQPESTHRGCQLSAVVSSDNTSSASVSVGPVDRQGDLVDHEGGLVIQMRDSVGHQGGWEDHPGGSVVQLRGTIVQRGGLVVLHSQLIGHAQAL